jgi:hypothetical protein
VYGVAPIDAMGGPLPLQKSPVTAPSGSSARMPPAPQRARAASSSVQAPATYPGMAGLHERKLALYCARNFIDVARLVAAIILLKKGPTEAWA